MTTELANELPRVLIIDDDAISRDVLGMMLEMHGVIVDSADGGGQALEMLDNRSDDDTLPKLILMDTQMPGVSGVELVRLIRRMSSARIVAISGSEPGLAIREVTDGFLLKPVQAEDIVAILDGDLRQRRQPTTMPFAPEGQTLEIKSIVDPVVLGKFKAMMTAAAVREIYSAVATDLRTRLEILDQAMNSQNIAEVQRISHSIKGGCAMVGVTLASEAASRLEISNLPVTWPLELAELQDALGALEGMLVGDFPA